MSYVDTRRSSILFQATTRSASKGACRILMAETGPFTVCLGIIGNRREDRQRAVYRHWTKARLLAADRVIAMCGSPRCRDKRHLHCIPAPKMPKAPRTPA